MHRQRRGHASSARQPNMVALVAMHRRGFGQTSSRRWPCIVTSAAMHRHFDNTPSLMK